MIRFCRCPRGFEKTVGFGILALCVGVLAGKVCPASVLAAVAVILLAFAGYVCLFNC